MGSRKMFYLSNPRYLTSLAWGIVVLLYIIKKNLRGGGSVRYDQIKFELAYLDFPGFKPMRYGI